MEARECQSVGVARIVESSAGLAMSHRATISPDARANFKRPDFGSAKAMPTQSRGHGTRETPDARAKLKCPVSVRLRPCPRKAVGMAPRGTDWVPCPQLWVGMASIEGLQIVRHAGQSRCRGIRSL